MTAERPHGVTVAADDPAPAASVRSFSLSVVEGGPARVWTSAADRCSVGSDALNDLVLDDPTVSRFHCEIRLEPAGATLHDLDSRNGTVLDGVHVREALLRGGSILRLGRTQLRFQFGLESNRLPLYPGTAFGPMVGTSVAMRTTFAYLERAAKADVTVLLEGETGTGKGAAAAALHAASARSARPFVVVDCATIPVHLMESELFGHEKGAFTGASARRVGAFEEAHGGTLFLDEIGELPLDLQPKLLRALENRAIRRVGSNAFFPVDVRLLAATNRDLRAEVNAGRFRADLYYRLAVVKIVLPPLRQRPEDIPAIVERMLDGLGVGAEERQRLREPEVMAGIQRAAWTGNVRELRNYVERALIFPEDPPGFSTEAAAPQAALPAWRELPYARAREAALEAFERTYLEALLERVPEGAGRAAQVAEMDRVYLYRLLKKHGLGAKASAPAARARRPAGRKPDRER